MTPQEGFEQIEKKLGLNKHSDRWLIAMTAYADAIAFAREHPEAIGLDKLIAEAVENEREACVKIAEDNLRNTDLLLSSPPQSSAACNIRNAIRARGKTESE